MNICVCNRQEATELHLCFKMGSGPFRLICLRKQGGFRRDLTPWDSREIWLTGFVALTTPCWTPSRQLKLSDPAHLIVTQGCQESTQNILSPGRQPVSMPYRAMLFQLYCSVQWIPGGGDFPMETVLCQIAIPSLMYPQRPLLSLLDFFLFSFSSLRTGALSS